MNIIAISTMMCQSITNQQYTGTLLRKTRVRTHFPSQKMTIAAIQIALKKVCAQRS